MKEQGGIVGGEVSAHYSFRDNYCSDSGFISFVIFGCESNDNPVNHGTNNLKATNKVLVELFTMYIL